MSDYEFIDHSYDVVVIGAGGAGLRATLGLAHSGVRPRTFRIQYSVHHQGVSDTQPHGRGAGWNQRCAGQHGRGRLALAYVRHGQGIRLAR